MSRLGIAPRELVVVALVMRLPSTAAPSIQIMRGVPVPIPCPEGITILQAPVVTSEEDEKRPGVLVPTDTAIVRAVPSAVAPASL
ncbi:UNVERIFIED_CONTAM: hypothetical protein DVV46_10475 [Lactobacillus paragasseri]|nr:hypothetical protein [Lactobacillus paragasseri]